VKERANPEMQGLRELVSGRLQAQAGGPHPDPDVLAAFAENALLEAERAQLLQHLGACRDCREILYLAAPEGSAEAQKVPSFQAKRSRSLVFRWGALAASIVIVGIAVGRQPHLFRVKQPSAMVAKAPQVSNYAKVAEEKAPPEVDSLRDARAGRERSPEVTTKERPAAKPMTAKPQAKMDFDESDQVRIASGAVADQSKKERSDDLAVAARNVARLPDSPVVAGTPATPATAELLGKDKSVFAKSGTNDVRPAEAYAKGGLGGTVVDPLGAVVGNAKVTVSGPVGAQAVTSDAEGKFRFDSLAPGTYSVKTEASGFKSSEIRQVSVLDDKTSTLGVRLEPGTTSETVEVSGAAAANEIAAAPPSRLTTNGFVFAQKQVAQSEMQKAGTTDAPTRVKAAALATPRWTLSAEGAVQRSFDFGKSWQKVTVASDTTFRALCSMGQHVWAGGSAGVLYHSRDSGESWVRVTPLTPNRKLSADVTRIEFSDPANGSVTTVNGEVWITSDGGQSWRLK